jgi:cytochrome c biogenesis protein CcmG/thiol:disulfide interchange protein DsbE
VVLNYWASWCVPCIAEHAELVRLSESYPSAAVQLIGVLFQDERENGRRFMSRMGGDWPIVTDEGSRTSIRYGVYGVPETFFIGADGVVAYRQVGPVTWPLIVSKIDSLLAAGRLPPSESMDPLETSDRPETPAPASR